MAARYAFMAIASGAVASAQPYSDEFYTTTTRSTSAFWTYTARYEEAATESPYTYYDGSVITDTYTVYRTIKDDVTPTASPYSTSTGSGFDDLQVIAEYYTAGAIPDSDLIPETTDLFGSSASTKSTTTSIEFIMPVTMTAPSSCPTPFTVTTTAAVTVPPEVTAQVTPTSVKTDTSSVTGDYYIHMYETWYLSAGAAPFTSTTNYYYEYYIAECSTPPMSYAYPTGTTSGSDDNDSSSSSWYNGCDYYYCTPFATYVIVVASVIPGLFLLGFIESWFWFRRLMMGKSAMRFGTVCWVLISLWILCFTRMQDRRSREDQKLLAEKWKNMGSGAAFKAWWKWGFRHRYPEELLGQYCKTTVGIVPPDQPLHPAMAQTPGGFPPGAPAAPGQVYYYGPPPPGWVQAPNGGFMPPQGYMYPQTQQGGSHGDAMKDGGLVSHSPVSAISEPTQPQPIHSAQQGTNTPTPHGAPPNVGPVSAPPSPPPQGSLTTTPPPPAATQAPQLPPVNNGPQNRDLYG
ncbi:uncharacterized protein SETTUDRAFT_161082 [Exserohilum turcica Et28A]|uniref:Uncharacterized protein n=1 Tax=Exserohilum turcicum (strain 28A) TaxID=671987 RepID=R0IRN8_EXST2|nr:uncharacterized protein SETTUDRAFT_161082 [Exserohilum turcica Et28A]EOA87535.1 hypothetical protein SETTUDRAFT_161082 [Exserohilum turcica Et28A]